MKRYFLFVVVFVIAVITVAQVKGDVWAPLQDNADMARRMGYQPYRVDSANTNTLGLELEALAFFKDNEFDGSVQCGYSLPGVRLQPRLTYTPIDEIKLELGLHATIYSGANKFRATSFTTLPSGRATSISRVLICCRFSVLRLVSAISHLL